MTEWEVFFNSKIRQIFEKANLIVDIGGGLRIKSDQGNRYNKNRNWLRPYLKRVNYLILDPVVDYNPNIVGDIHNLPFRTGSLDAIICIAVLEHVENPTKAFLEMYRVLKRGGLCFIYVPFIYPYHAQPGYYGDFWRFSEDALKHLSRRFSSVSIQSIRAPLETLVYISPLTQLGILNSVARVFDSLLGIQKSKQTSGHYLSLSK